MLSLLTLRSLRRKQGCVLERLAGNPTPAVRTPGVQIYLDCIAKQRHSFYTSLMLKNLRKRRQFSIFIKTYTACGINKQSDYSTFGKQINYKLNLHSLAEDVATSLSCIADALFHVTGDNRILQACLWVI